MMGQDFIAIVCSRPLKEILGEYPIGRDFLANFRLINISEELSMPQALAEVNDDVFEEFGIDRDELLQKFCSFLEKFTQEEAETEIVISLTINGGVNKSKKDENVSLTIVPGQIVSIVGPTGSGKSRLLSDIECVAQRDTPTGRQILINGVELDDFRRFEMEGKLVAQLSQNMNFVMDLTVNEFLKLHAKSRMTVNPEESIRNCFECANSLAGEEFSGNTKLTQLSGGQSRALMIADTAYMNSSPIVLIDEIENAGIDRRQAMTILAKMEKIIFLSTHDPLLALIADKRIVMRNGGIEKVIETSKEEKDNLAAIERIDNVLQGLRKSLRAGELIKTNLPMIEPL